NLLAGKDSIRMIIGGWQNCIDTTNYIPIKIHGAVAGFEITANNVCYKLPASFRDTSSAQNTTIISRQWDFGDGQMQTVTSGGIISHTYAAPGSYYVTLKIADASGCTSTTSSYTQMVSVNGPNADFSISQSDAHLNSTIYFYNNTNNYGSYNTQYEWQFGDGGTSGEYYPSYTYTKPGNYTIRLIAKNPDTGCGDTAYQKITVKNFNANFSFTSSFVDNIDCSSLLVQFVNTSYDYTHIKWDFGDGFTSDNVNMPSHVYAQPGNYLVKLFVTGNNGLSKTYLDSVIVVDNKVNITANLLQTCTAQSVTLSAVSQNASSYVWDFGDGTLAQASDTFSVHYYKSPGNYIPKLIAKDSDGCAASVMLTNKISIDSLNVSLKSIPKICAPKEVQFNPDITSIGSGQGQQSLSYHWDFGTGNKTDTANIETPSFTYQQPGNYKVSVQIKSPAGCVKQAETNIVALQGLGGQISGPSDICVATTAQFTGSTLIAGQPSWKWIFDDGTVVNEKDPPAKQYNAPGNFIVKLVVDNGGCIDTVNKLLQVHAKPNVALSLSDTTICEGASISAIAGGGSVYSWSPSAGLNATNGAIVIASPLNNTIYNVAVSDTFGCSSNASLS
ncbi:MAG: PKD domain-containing protein, partial [Mucilaginibacter sp.]